MCDGCALSRLKAKIEDVELAEIIQQSEASFAAKYAHTDVLTLQIDRYLAIAGAIKSYLLEES